MPRGGLGERAADVLKLKGSFDFTSSVLILALSPSISKGLTINKLILAFYLPSFLSCYASLFLAPDKRKIRCSYSCNMAKVIHTHTHTHTLTYTRSQTYALTHTFIYTLPEMWTPGLIPNMTIDKVYLHGQVTLLFQTSVLSSENGSTTIPMRVVY